MRVNKIGVIYLARPATGFEHMEAFADSYRRHPAGVDHELIVVYKGIEKAGVLAAARGVFADIPHRAIDLGDVGFDINVYFTVAKGLDHDYLAFLNTYSKIESDGWLEKLYSHASRPGVGAAGASASYESIYSSHKLFDKAIFLTASKGICYDPLIAEQFSYALSLHVPLWMSAGDSPVKRLRRVVGDLRRRSPPADSRFDEAYLQHWEPLTTPGYVLAMYGEFPAFPNPHLRSTGFMMSRNNFLGTGYNLANTKEDCVRFESSVTGLSNRLRGEGKSLILVGADGVGYDVPDWSASRTFRLGDQANLMITDNQTRNYPNFKGLEREMTAYITWGEYLGPPSPRLRTLGFRFAVNDAVTGPNGQPGPAPSLAPTVRHPA